MVIVTCNRILEGCVRMSKVPNSLGQGSRECSRKCRWLRRIEIVTVLLMVSLPSEFRIDWMPFIKNGVCRRTRVVRNKDHRSSASFQVGLIRSPGMWFHPEITRRGVVSGRSSVVGRTGFRRILGEGVFRERSRSKRVFWLSLRSDVIGVGRCVVVGSDGLRELGARIRGGLSSQPHTRPTPLVNVNVLSLYSA
jgi:hypothetical protein